MEQLVTDTSHTNAFASITESFGTRNQQHVVICISTYRRLIRWLKGYTKVLAEVHSKVSQILHYNGIILGGQSSNSLQLVFVQTNPSRIIRIGIDDGTDVTILQITLHLGTQFLTSEIIDIKGFVLNTHYLQLHLLNRETWVDEKHRILFFRSLRTGKERSIRALHRTCYWHAALRSNIQSDEGLHKARCFLLQCR